MTNCVCPPCDLRLAAWKVAQHAHSMQEHFCMLHSDHANHAWGFSGVISSCHISVRHDTHVSQPSCIIPETQLELANAVCCYCLPVSLGSPIPSVLPSHLSAHTKLLLHIYTFHERRDEVILQGLSYSATTAMALVYGGLLALMGVLISWAAPACNNPIFAEIVPPHLRNMIYSFDRSALHHLFIAETAILARMRLTCLATQSCACCACFAAILWG